MRLFIEYLRFQTVCTVQTKINFSCMYFGVYGNYSIISFQLLDFCLEALCGHCSRVAVVAEEYRERLIVQLVQLFLRVGTVGLMVDDAFISPQRCLSYRHTWNFSTTHKFGHLFFNKTQKCIATRVELRPPVLGLIQASIIRRLTD